MTKPTGTRLREASEVESEQWQTQHQRERELDAHGFADDDLVPAILGDMEHEYSKADHDALMAAARDGSKSAAAKIGKATRDFVTTRTNWSDTPAARDAETMPADVDDLSLTVDDD